MALVTSLLTAIVRADGDALVMHVGEKPYVVASAGPIELSSQGLNLQAMTGMIAQLLPFDAQRTLAEFGAVEHELSASPDGDRFTVVVARGGDDIWIEIRRHRRPAVAMAPPVAPVVEAPAVAADLSEPPVSEPASVAEPAQSAAPMSVAESAPTPELAVAPGAVVMAAEVAPAIDVPESAPEPQPAVAEAQPEYAAVADVDVAPAAEVIEPEIAAVVAEAMLEPGIVAPPDATAAAKVITEEVEAPLTPPAAESEPESDGEPEAEPLVVAVAEGAPAHVEAAASAPEIVEAAARVPEEAVEVVQPLVAREAHHEQTVKYAASAPIAAIEQHAVNFGATSASYGRPEQEATYSASASPREEHASFGAPAPPNAPAAVIPMTRTLRIEVPPSSSSRQPAPPAHVERLLGAASRRGATALYLITDSAPYIRVDSDVRVLEDEPPLSAQDIEAAVLAVATDTSRESLRRGEALEWFAEVAGAGRVHCSTFRDHRGPGAIFQLISMRPMTAEQLGLSSDIQELVTESQGLVLIAGTRGNGRHSLTGALVDLINRRRPHYVITLEQQVSIVHDSQHALISQREVGSPEQLLGMTRAALRENPDVLVFEELPPADVFALALEAAGSGVLVLMSVAAPSTTAAITSAVELFAPEKRRAVQNQLAEHLRGAVAQVLLRHSRGGRAAARELLLPTLNVSTVLIEGQLENLARAIEDGRSHGLVSLNQALVQLIRDGAIDLREAYRKTDDRSALVAALKRENIDTAVVERLA